MGAASLPAELTGAAKHFVHAATPPCHHWLHSLAEDQSFRRRFSASTFDRFAFLGADFQQMAHCFAAHASGTLCDFRSPKEALISSLPLFSRMPKGLARPERQYQK